MDMQAAGICTPHGQQIGVCRRLVLHSAPAYSRPWLLSVAHKERVFPSGNLRNLCHLMTIPFSGTLAPRRV